MRLLDHGRSTATTWPSAATASAPDAILVAMATVVAGIELVVPAAPHTELAISHGGDLPLAAPAEAPHPLVSQGAALEPPSRTPAASDGNRGDYSEWARMRYSWRVGRATPSQTSCAAPSIGFSAELPVREPSGGEPQAADTVD